MKIVLQYRILVLFLCVFMRISLQAQQEDLIHTEQSKMLFHFLLDESRDTPDADMINKYLAPSYLQEHGSDFFLNFFIVDEFTIFEQEANQVRVLIYHSENEWCHELIFDIITEGNQHYILPNQTPEDSDTFLNTWSSEKKFINYDIVKSITGTKMDEQIDEVTDEDLLVYELMLDMDEDEEVDSEEIIIENPNRVATESSNENTIVFEAVDDPLYTWELVNGLVLKSYFGTKFRRSYRLQYEGSEAFKGAGIRKYKIIDDHSYHALEIFDLSELSTEKRIEINLGEEPYTLNLYTKAGGIGPTIYAVKIIKGELK